MSAFRIGIVTCGGDCPGLNAVIRGVVRSANQQGWEVFGFEEGYEGLLAPAKYRLLAKQNTAGILCLGGTILGTSNRGRFAAKIGQGEKHLIDPEIILEAKKTLEELQIQALVCIGGDGSLSTALQLQDAGVNVVGVPKTIDNDLSCTATSFGFDSAIECVADACDRLHTTATSHRRAMVLEVMGRYAGWIALYGGMAGGADLILIPEIPFKMASVEAFINQRRAIGARSSIVVVAEGAFPQGEALMALKGSNKEGELKLGGIGQRVSDEIQARTGQESRCVVLGHLQRGGDPTTTDRILGTRFGVHAVELIKEKKFGHMVSYLNYEVGAVTIADAVGILKTVPPSSQIIAAARATGISFGD
ncbi:MAG: ATP-dependent 6-phosphofructokinase [Verrucomicrobiota bacterium]